MRIILVIILAMALARCLLGKSDEVRVFREHSFLRVIVL